MSGRTRYVWRNGHWVAIDRDAPLPPRVTPYVRSDAADYRSVITGEMISGKAAHREHLRTHHCIEVGNEFVPTQRETMGSPIEEIQAALQASPETHAEARAASERAMNALDD